ncbi:unnamed protein product [Lampetra planeri]
MPQLVQGSPLEGLQGAPLELIFLGGSRSGFHERARTRGANTRNDGFSTTTARNLFRMFPLPISRARRRLLSVPTPVPPSPPRPRRAANALSTAALTASLPRHSGGAKDVGTPDPSVTVPPRRYRRQPPPRGGGGWSKCTALRTRRDRDPPEGTECRALPGRDGGGRGGGWRLTRQHGWLVPDVTPPMPGHTLLPSRQMCGLVDLPHSAARRRSPRRAWPRQRLEQPPG